MGDHDERSAGDSPRYDNRLRQERMAQTRARMVAAGCDSLHESPTWEWSDLTYRAAAQRSGVAQGTVVRDFPTERELHGAILARLAEQAGVDLRRAKPALPHQSW